MEINLLQLWSDMGLPIRVVVIALTLQAVACVGVVVDRLLLLYQAGKRSRDAAVALQAAMESGQYEKATQALAEAQPNHLTRYLEEGLRTFLTQRAAGQDVLRSGELARRALGRKGDTISRELNRGMNVLASTGSTAPFIGLLGTVLGIIHAFRVIAATGSGGIGTIGASIGEALIVTGYGLIVAIPSVLIFNGLSARIAAYEAGMVNAGGELIDRLESGSTRATPSLRPSLAEQVTRRPPLPATEPRS
ncbi:MAG: MotA/TolQ/ExbB proton channel family protein [Polyangiales bacterium]